MTKVITIIIEFISVKLNPIHTKPARRAFPNLVTHNLQKLVTHNLQNLVTHNLQNLVSHNRQNLATHNLQKPITHNLTPKIHNNTTMPHIAQVSWYTFLFSSVKTSTKTISCE